MTLKHNKKRNVGLIREFFSLYVSDCIINNKQKQLSEAKKIWSKYFNVKSELQKEMKIFSIVSKYAFEDKRLSESLSKDLITSVKSSLKKIEDKKLDLEKTNFIREVNDKLGLSFFDKKVANYNQIAGVHLLFNHWKRKNINEGIINPAYLELEDKLYGLLVSEKKNNNNEDLLKKNLDSEVDFLVIDIMRKKLNEKFDHFTTEQKNLLKSFVFSNSEEVKKQLESIRVNSLKLISEELQSTKSSKQQKDKLKDIQGLLNNEYSSLDIINENTVTFYMSVAQLYNELSDKDTK